METSSNTGEGSPSVDVAAQKNDGEGLAGAIVVEIISISSSQQ